MLPPSQISPLPHEVPLVVFHVLSNWGGGGLAAGEERAGLPAGGRWLMGV